MGTGSPRIPAPPDFYKFMNRNIQNSYKPPIDLKKDKDGSYKINPDRFDYTKDKK